VDAHIGEKGAVLGGDIMMKVLLALVASLVLLTSVSVSAHAGPHSLGSRTEDGGGG
jgi:hypothetical protein